MESFRQFIRLLGEIVDPFMGPRLNRYIPTHLQGLSIEQRAAATIAEGFRIGLSEVTKRRPELAHVQQKEQASDFRYK